MTQEEYKIHYQPDREIYVKIELLDNITERVIDRLEGVCIDGNINISAKSDIRRNCSLSMIVKNQNYLPSPNSRIWINRRFRLFTGIKSLLTDDIIWFNQDKGGHGIFVMNRPSIDSSINGSKILSIEGLDKMCLMNGKLDGKLASAISFKMDAGIDINTALKGAWGGLGGETKLNLDIIGKTLPYLIEKKPGDNIYEILKQISDLYMNWEIFYDTNGYGVFTQIKNRLNDPIAWDFTDFDFRINSKSEPDWENIYNAVYIWGKKLADGTQIKAYVENTDVKNPFSTVNMYKKELPISDSKIFTMEQALIQANYQLDLHSNENEKVSFTCLPIYTLDVNNIVNFNSPEDNLVGHYLIDEISFGLKYDATMNCSGYKLYI